VWVLKDITASQPEGLDIIARSSVAAAAVQGHTGDEAAAAGEHEMDAVVQSEVGDDAVVEVAATYMPEHTELTMEHVLEEVEKPGNAAIKTEMGDDTMEVADVVDQLAEAAVEEAA
jgi:hypothetical protein